jgi:hypothetical protein
MVRDLTLTMKNKKTGELETWSVKTTEWFSDELFDVVDITLE